jgi:hypothetical protein
MMAAITAAQGGKRVLLLEKMPHPGTKLLLTGNGRCNFGNNLEPARFIRDCGPRTRFLYNALSRFSNRDTVSFFAERGVIARLEESHSYFPLSGGAAGVLQALERSLVERGVELRTSAAVSIVRRKGTAFWVESTAGQFECRALVIATGGQSHQLTGSDGSGYGLAEGFGHGLTAVLPGNVPLLLEGNWFAALQGVSLRDCRLSFTLEGKDHVFAGGLLFTHYGISGPAALDASRVLAPALECGKVTAVIDLLPATDGQKLDRQLVSAAARFGKKQLRGLVGLLVPGRLAQAVVERVGLRNDSPANQLGAGQREDLVRGIKQCEVTITGTRGFDEAMVTMGGVDTSELNPATLESKKTPGLYFCGEVLDVDGPCGGYNLQIAWTTGHAAGRAAAGADNG